MQLTTNHNLKKPQDTDNADLRVFVGDNMDIIDPWLPPSSGTNGYILVKADTGVEWDEHDHSDEFAAINHDHDDVYAAIAHNHDGVYSPIGHDHDDDYAAINHNHDSDYANINHHHDGDTIRNAKLKGYKEAVKAHGNSSGTITLDLADGNVHELNQTGDITIAFSNWPASGTNGSITLIAHHDSTERTWTWPASVVWPDAKPPDMSGTDTTTILTFTTIDGGTTVYGFVAGQNFGSGA